MKLPSLTKLYQKLEEIEKVVKYRNITFIDIDQASLLLQLKKSYLYQLVHKNQLPYYKPNGKKIYFNKAELNEWINNSKIHSVDEIENDFINGHLLNKNNRVSQGY
ncbi:MAG: helix-turn-helix domain-containing protein [Melioribacteraceae bacterium]|nr:helix-turn-helix domain-containing protein [Melioribacteraceae bacterium]MCF8265256.1 helix-turn-helix domain-containing protein [Melioribacteraceae bacterium]MCF8412949.1 helix-turn-helix domain-containing protein [Melioribacteraceae bacterium]